MTHNIRALPFRALALATDRCTSAYAAKTARDEVKPGEYLVDQTVRIRGTLTVGEDYDQRITAAIPVWELLALALSKLNGVTVNALVHEHTTLSQDGADPGAAERLEAVKASAREAVDKIKGTSLQRCKGKVTTALTAEVIGMSPNLGYLVGLQEAGRRMAEAFKASPPQVPPLRGGLVERPDRSLSLFDRGPDEDIDRQGSGI